MFKNFFNAIRDGINECGALFIFGSKVIQSISKGISLKSVIEQMYAVGVRSITTTVACGFFVGGIMAIQLNLQLKDFGAQAYLGGLSTSVTIRNIGPILIAFILSGKVGAYTSAELGTMSVTDQLNALKSLGIHPIPYLIATRLVAVVISSFLLLILGLIVSVGGGIFISELKLGVNSLEYIHRISSLVTWESVLTGVGKSFVFGLIIGMISCFYGYRTRGGAFGVGKSVRKTAVMSLVVIIVVDYLMSRAMEMGWDFFGG